MRPRGWQVDLANRLHEVLLWAADPEPKPMRVILIDAPQRSGKTEVVLRAIAWAMAELSLSCGLICYDFAKLAKPHSRAIKRMLRSEHARIAWPHLAQPVPPEELMNEAGHWNVPNKHPGRAAVEFIATGRSGGIEGATLPVVVVDDLYKSIADAASLANNAAVADLLASSAVGRVAADGGVIIDIGTRRGKRDTKGYWLGKAAELEAAGLEPVIERWSYPLRGTEPWRYGEHGYLTESWYPDKEKATRIAMGPTLARILLDGEDVDAVGDLYDLDVHLSHFYDVEPSQMAKLCRMNGSTYLSVDTAETEGGGDWTSVGWIGEHEGAAHLLRAWRFQLGTMGVVAAINDIIEETGVGVAHIEYTSAGKAAVDFLAPLLRCAVVPFNPTGRGPKRERIRSTLPMLAMGKFRFPRPTCREDVSWCYGLDDAGLDMRTRLAAINGVRPDLAGEVDDEADMITIYMLQRTQPIATQGVYPTQSEASALLARFRR